MDALLIHDEAAEIAGWEPLRDASEAAGLRLTRATGIARGLDGIDPGEIDAVLLHLGGRDMRASALVSRLRALAKAVPVVVIATEETPEIAAELLHAGVQDLLPPEALRGAVLARITRNAVARSRAASALRMANGLLEVVSRADGMPELLAGVSASLRQHCRSSAAGIRLVDRSGRLPFAAEEGFPEAYLAVAGDQRVGSEGGACALVAEGRHPGGVFRVDGPAMGGLAHASQSLRLMPCTGHGTAGACHCGRFGFRAVAVFPVRHRGRVFGTLNVAADRLRCFHEPLLHALDAAGLQLGAAIDRFQLADRVALREQRYHALVTAISTAVFSVDASGRMGEPQSEWLAFSGQSPERAAGRGWLEAIHDEDREALLALWASPAARVGLHEVEARAFATATGAHHRCVLRAVPRQDDAGRLLEWIVALSDVQAEREAAEERHQLELQLRQAQRMESVGRLAGGVAHDFNNLLTIVQGNLYLLGMVVPTGGEGSEELDAIRKATGRASELTRQLLTFSRRQVVKPERLDLNAVVGGLEKMLRRVLGEDIALDVQLASALEPVLADPGLVEQVLMNLALYGRDAMPRGGRLTVATAMTELDSRWARLHLAGGPGRHVMLSVSDTGPGLDPEAQSRIFEPFGQSSVGAPHSGLGLAVVYGIVKQHGGHIFVKSAEGEGTAFKIYLPALGSDSSHRETTSAEQRKLGALHGSETLLLVEDEAEVRDLVARVLERYGYRVLEAADGPAALALARSSGGAIDLVVSDVVMPGMYGPEVVEALRADRPGLRVLYISGFTDNVVLQQGVPLSEVCFLEKPFTPETLVMAVRRALRAG